MGPHCVGDVAQDKKQITIDSLQPRTFEKPDPNINDPIDHKHRWLAVYFAKVARWVDIALLRASPDRKQ